MSKAAGTVSVNHNGRPLEVLAEHVLAVRLRLTAIRLVRPITAAIINLARSAQIQRHSGSRRARLHSAVDTTTARAQITARRISAEWARIVAPRLRRISALRREPASALLPCRTPAPHITARLRSMVEAAARLTVVAVVPSMVAEEVPTVEAAGILLRAVIVAAEGHDSFPQPLRLS